MPFALSLTLVVCLSSAVLVYQFVSGSFAGDDTDR